MIMFRQFMPARAQRQYQTLGDFVFIENAPGPVRISTEKGYYILNVGAQVQSDQLTGTVTVENWSDTDGQISLVSGFGRYTPPADGQKVKVTEAPPVVIADGQQVAVSSLPAVEIAANQQVAVSQMPDVQLAANQQIAVSQLPAVQVAPDQQIAVSQLPAVQVAPDQQIAVSQLPAVQVAPDQQINARSVLGSSLITSTLTITTGAAELPANASRMRVIVRAADANTQPVLIGGVFPLKPGEREEFAITGALSFTGTDSETINVMEVLA